MPSHWPSAWSQRFPYLVAIPIVAISLLAGGGKLTPADPVHAAPAAPARFHVDLPSEPPPSVAPARALASSIHWAYMVGSHLPPSLVAHPGDIDVLAPAWFHLDAAGNVQGHDVPAVSAFARAHGIKLVPVVTNGSFSPSVAHRLVSNGATQTRMLDGLQWLVRTYNYDGVNIDFENVPAGDRPLLDAMMSNVYARLHSLGKLVTIALPAKTHQTTSGFSGAFDYAGLAPNFDLAVVMAYDEHYSGGPAGPIADAAWVNDVARYASIFIPPGKLLLGVPFFGYDWNVSGGGHGVARAYPAIAALALAHGTPIRVDAASESPTLVYDGGNGIHRVWFEDSTSLKAKLDIARAMHLAGWAAWRLGQEDPNFWTLSLTPRTMRAEVLR
ncbi:MAG: glycosyl hydrolase family 18 protein [Chloroflexota bacterium]